MNLAVDWGRYAEILSDDDDTEFSYLEPAGTSRTQETGAKLLS